MMSDYNTEELLFEKFHVMLKKLAKLGLLLAICPSQAKYTYLVF